MQFNCIKMKYSIEPRNRVYVKGYGFLSFAKNIGKNLSNKYTQKIIDTAEKSAADALKTASKKAIQKTAEATGDLIGNKVADKITSSANKKSNKNISTIDKDTELTTTTNKKRCILPKERQQIIDELRLVPM